MDNPDAVVHKCANYEAFQCQHETVTIATIKGNLECRAFLTPLSVRYSPLPVGPTGEGLPPVALPKRLLISAAAYYELPELPQAIFYAMLLNEAEKLGVLHGPRLRSLEVAVTELRRGAFESWIWLFGDRVYEARFHLKSSLDEGARAGRQGETSSGGAADDVAPEDGLATRSLGNSLACHPPPVFPYKYIVLLPYGWLLSSFAEEAIQ
ncbi:hypothetical protein Cgig2_021903 [Carnegiea gigantea]|uniref:Uncharacterized protein n=1 Tax=Carnegiea gigantea TaxID=171969 RepID=A0A9Q1JWR2_9CARY|nr:hypothetical protein Cgig2_021903 [Carnegiea gigantea]